MTARGSDLDLLGRREDQHLEFKAGEVLAEPEKVAREVVGMLNALGGAVWIGVAEQDGMAARIEPVPQAAKARDRLFDFLLETLEPSPTAEEVRIDLVPEGGEEALLRIDVKPLPGRGPYAFLRKGGRHFLKRVGARLHPMSRDEWLGAGSKELGREKGEEAAARTWLAEARKSAQEQGAGGLWLGLAPAAGLELDLEAGLFDEIVTNPVTTGNRRSGFSFHVAEQRPRRSKKGIEWVGTLYDGLPVHRVVIGEEGRLVLSTSLVGLLHKGEERELWPATILEYPVSGFRIARTIFQRFDLEPEDSVVADLALLGVAGWGLRAGTPREVGFSSTLLRRQDEPDLVWEPLTFIAREVYESPDRCALRFIRRIYRAFGFRAEDIPREFDQERGRLILPE